MSPKENTMEGYEDIRTEQSTLVRCNECADALGYNPFCETCEDARQEMKARFNLRPGQGHYNQAVKTLVSESA